MKKGKLCKAYWVYCGFPGCETTETLVPSKHPSNIVGAERKLTLLGWRHTKRLGWFCPACVKEKTYDKSGR